MQPETDVSSELPLTLFDVIHPGLAGVLRWSVLSADFTLQLTNIRDGDCTERDCLQPLIKMHSVILSSEMGLFCVKKQLILQCICNHWPAVFISTSRSQWIESGFHTPVAWLCRHAGFIGEKSLLPRRLKECITSLLCPWLQWLLLWCGPVHCRKVLTILIVSSIVLPVSSNRITDWDTWALLFPCWKTSDPVAESERTKQSLI